MRTRANELVLPDYIYTLHYKFNIHMNSLENLNQQLYLFINADLSTGSGKIIAASFCAEYLVYVIPLILAIKWCWGDVDQRSIALKACFVTFLALGINQLIIMLWPHPRPFAIGLGHTFIAHAADPSFPSDHATVFSAIGLTIIFAQVRSWSGWLMLIMSGVVAWARIFLGVHFPLDMFGAVIVASVTWLAVTPIWFKYGGAITQQLNKAYCIMFAPLIARHWLKK